MNTTLALELYKYNLLPKHTKLYANYTTRDVAGNICNRTKGLFSLIEVKVKDNLVYFLTENEHDLKKEIISAVDVIEIDGMSPERFLDGNMINEKLRKPGRKPKYGKHFSFN